MKRITSWHTFLSSEFKKPYFKALEAYVKGERKQHVIYPPEDLTFAAFKECPLEKLKTVILGQDPYHGEGQATGLAFSVPDGFKLPPSLKNIYKEVATDLNMPAPTDGDLTRWAEQGVLLLNTTLTVRKGEPLSHAKQGWEIFTTAVLSHLIREPRPLVFVLWGNAAKEKYADAFKIAGEPQNPFHLVLSSAHPSPFSARLFHGSRPFSKVNIFLNSLGISPVNFS